MLLMSWCTTHSHCMHAKPTLVHTAGCGPCSGWTTGENAKRLLLRNASASGYRPAGVRGQGVGIPGCHPRRHWLAGPAPQLRPAVKHVPLVDVYPAMLLYGSLQSRQGLQLLPIAGKLADGRKCGINTPKLLEITCVTAPRCASVSARMARTFSRSCRICCTCA